ncbi:MAG: hypothetical protein AB7T63_15825 [Planctomycetota bacterium]
MRSATPLAWLLVTALLGTLVVAAPAESGPGPGRPIRPKPSNTDAMLWDKAQRIQARMWHHLSPEGLLVYEHGQGAGPDGLSYEVLSVSDAAIWTGCYLGAQACRWSVTRDPDALAQVDHLLRGLSFLAHVTGTPGRLCRSAGRLADGRVRPRNVVDSPSMPGYVFQDDVSRDQLVGVVFGLALVLMYVDDPALVARAETTLGVIAKRLASDNMWLRNSRGGKTEFGELRPTVEHLPMIKNGPLAAIGYAPFLVLGSRAGEPWYRKRKDRMDRDGWRNALPEQHTWLGQQITMTNVNMVTLGLTPIALWGDPLARDNARRGLRSLYAATRGWWNAGTCACQLLADSKLDRRALVDEIRATLHIMSEQEIPFAGTRMVRTGRIVDIRERGIVDWAWKIHVDAARVPPPGAALDPIKTYTRADWLFAYWIARAAGELAPGSGPGAQSPPPPVVLDLPPWMAVSDR